MEKVIDRVQIIIHDKKLSVSAFEKMCGLSNATISATIRRHSNLNEETINSILNTFPEYSAAWLITGKGGKLVKNELVSHISEEPKRYLAPAVISVDQNDNENIILVPVKARAGYLNGYYKPEFMKTLPTYRMPGLNNGTFRAFEVKGQSMNLTLHNKSYAIGEFVEDWPNNIKDDRIYIIIHEDHDNDRDGVLIKRCLNRISKYNNLICKSDNLDRRSYPNINLEPSTIKEVWEVKAGIVFEFTNPSVLYDRMNDLEADVQQLKKLIR